MRLNVGTCDLVVIGLNFRSVMGLSFLRNGIFNSYSIAKFKTEWPICADCSDKKTGVDFLTRQLDLGIFLDVAFLSILLTYFAFPIVRNII